MIGYIYHLTNDINNKKYIGKTINLQHRIEDHFSRLLNNKHHSHKLQHAVNKYGIDHFQLTYTEVEVENEQELNMLEIQEIEKYDSYYNGYNETLGGDGNASLFTFDLRVLIHQICNKYEGVKRQIARYFDCDDSTITAIANNEAYSKIEYSEDELTILINKIGISDENLKENYIKHNDRKLNKEQIFSILSIITTEYGYDKILCRTFGVK